MYKTKLKRIRSLSIDMTAMSDVAFLILVFFISASHFDQWEPLKINLPKYTNPNVCTAFQRDVGIIYIAADKVMFQVTSDSVRKLALSRMAIKYGVNFSYDEKAKFIQSPIIGASMAQLKQYDRQYLDWETPVSRPGIPYGVSGDELYDWIFQTRIADKIINHTALYITIKADENVKYPLIKRVMDILTSQKINRFSLLTEHKNSAG